MDLASIKQSLKREKSQGACSSCRQKKRRCDGALPACALCVHLKRAHLCHYGPVEKKSKSEQEEAVEKLKQENERLRQALLEMQNGFFAPATANARKSDTSSIRPSSPDSEIGISMDACEADIYRQIDDRFAYPANQCIRSIFMPRLPNNIAKAPSQAAAVTVHSAIRVTNSDRPYIQIFLSLMNRNLLPLYNERRFVRCFEMLLTGKIEQTRSIPPPNDCGSGIKGPKCPYHSAVSNAVDIDPLPTLDNVDSNSISRFNLQLFAAIAMGAQMLGHKERAVAAFKESVLSACDVFGDAHVDTIAGMLALSTFLIATHQMERASSYLAITARLVRQCPVPEELLLVLLQLEALVSDTVEIQLGVEDEEEKQMKRITGQANDPTANASARTRQDSLAIVGTVYSSYKKSNITDVMIPHTPMASNGDPVELIIPRGPITLKMKIMRLLSQTPFVSHFASGKHFTQQQILDWLKALSELDNELQWSNEPMLRMFIHTIRMTVYMFNPHSPFAPRPETKFRPTLDVPNDPLWSKEDFVRSIDIVSQYASYYDVLPFMPFAATIAACTGFMHTHMKDLIGLQMDLDLMRKNADTWEYAVDPLRCMLSYLDEVSVSPLKGLPLPTTAKSLFAASIREFVHTRENEEKQLSVRKRDRDNAGYLMRVLNDTEFQCNVTRYTTRPSVQITEIETDSTSTAQSPQGLKPLKYRNVDTTAAPAVADAPYSSFTAAGAPPTPLTLDPVARVLIGSPVSSPLVPAPMFNIDTTLSAMDTGVSTAFPGLGTPSFMDPPHGIAFPSPAFTGLPFPFSTLEDVTNSAQNPISFDSPFLTPHFLPSRPES